ncbi:inorganic phosphate transporter, PiT family [Jatrophihabitans endophyticus]|uniref:Phosphate transporter n=1 Tax=Jatrophihabitans endophyticus TaxID=1206085 RepID=A0A1M5I039_9ACTN|nr:inorganic phosphate transporter [Jatrophihabitans endophyticus]SHG21575.1 inorganic phosphate transporter, PiT family [Jatrophihabitans endophyticus]
MDVSFLVVIVIATALAFDFTNGFHDTANAMATSIATGALRPRVAVVLSGVLNLVGAFLSTEVAKTISNGIVDDDKLAGHGVNGTAIIFAGLIGAVLWNLVTWLLGLPSSSSHALFGGLIGAVWVVIGTAGIHFDMVFSKIILPAVLSPVICGVIAGLATYAAYTLTRRAGADTSKQYFRHGQTISASLVSLAHGTGDAQKTMGVITLVLVINGHQTAGTDPQFWVILAAGTAIGLGTALGGWRIIRTMGTRLTEIESPQGFAAESASTAVLLASSHLGFALSTTQVVSGGILGSGVGRRLAEVRWNVAGRMALGWLFTLPVAAVVGALAGELASRGNGGTALVAALAVAAVALIVYRSRRDPVNPGNVNDSADARPDREPELAGAGR